jgi:putative flippase GtrA
MTLQAPAIETRARRRRVGREIVRFSLVGVIGFCVDAGVLILAVRLLGLNLYGARAISFLTAVTTTWALNRAVTFPHAASRSRATEWLRFVLSNAVGGAVNLGVYAWLVKYSPTVHEFPVVGVAYGSIAGLSVNFCLTKLFVFRGNAGR